VTEKEAEGIQAQWAERTERETDRRVYEQGTAYEESNLIVGKELQDAGIPMLKKWNTRGDSQVSDGCRQNADAGLIGLNDPWPCTEGTYHRQHPPRYPGCRCWMSTEVDPAYLQKARDRFGVR
jgi:hypothetical protein